MPKVRKATADDATAIAELIQLKRLQYATYQPTFWRVAADAVAQQAPYLRDVLARPDTIALAAEADDGGLAGALIARVRPSPSVYAPGGPTCVIDDYWLADPAAWDTLGRSLIAQASRMAKEAFGAAQLVAVCAQQDEPKRSMLRSESFTVASEWWTRPL